MAANGDQIVEVQNDRTGRVDVRRNVRHCWRNGCFGKMVGLSSKFFKRIVGEYQELHLRNERLMMFCVIATSVDPLFCYILLVDKDRWCVGFDNKLRTIAIILRSITDFLYIILTIYYFHDHYSLLNDETDSVAIRARKFFLSSFGVDVLAILPLPQVVALFVIPRFKGLQFIFAIRSLKYSLLTQYLLRVFRIYSFLKKSGWSTILPQVAEAKAIFNLVLYILASHVIGAFWYLSTIERKTACWQKQCQYCAFNCNYVLGIVNNGHNFCSAQVENGSKTFDFGIYKDALPIVYSKDFIRKISYCFWWGLQKLSSLGQDLTTSGHLLEIYFAITITISGLVLFALLIGNLQTYLQSTITGLEKIRMKERDIEECMSNHSIPRKLKRKIRKCKRHKQRETKGVGVEQLFQNLPKLISREIKEYLSSGSVLKVLQGKLGEDVDKRLLDAMYDLLKPKRYSERKYIVREGRPVDEVVFIIQGRVMVDSKKDGKGEWLTKGHFYGEELIDWEFSNPTSTTLPKSTKNIYALSEIEVFVLVANDLKTLVSKFWWLISKTCSQSSTEMWKPMAASAFLRAFERKKEKDNKIKE